MTAPAIFVLFKLTYGASPAAWLIDWSNAAARLVLGLSRSDLVRPALKELHWLPVVYRIKFKLALVMFTIHTHQCPDYLTDSVHPCSNNDPARYRLRSVTGTNYSVPRTRTKFGDRAFSVAGPVVWNSLPAAVRHADSLHSFKRRLKSHFFSSCFNDWQCNALQVQFRAWRTLNSHLLLLLHKSLTLRLKSSVRFLASLASDSRFLFLATTFCRSFLRFSTWRCLSSSFYGNKKTIRLKKKPNN